MNFEYLNFKSILNDYEETSQKDICFVFYEEQLIVKSNTNGINTFLIKVPHNQKDGVRDQRICSSPVCPQCLQELLESLV